MLGGIVVLPIGAWAFTDVDEAFLRMPNTLSELAALYRALATLPEGQPQ